jgi:hypothetical protein
LQHDLDLEWESACLHGEEETDDTAQVLTVNIKAINGTQLDVPTGFTVSFKQQQSPPDLLRLEFVPNRSASEKEHAQSWRQPPLSLRLALPPKNEELKGLDFPVPSSLEDEIRELRALQAEIDQLKKAIDRKKTVIESHSREAAESFKETLHQCNNVSCVVRALSTGAHQAWRLFYVKFRAKHHYEFHAQAPSSLPMGLPQDVDFHGRMKSNYAQIPEKSVSTESVKIKSVNFKPDAPQFSQSPAPQQSPSPPPSTADPSDYHHETPRLPKHDSPYVLALEALLGLLCCCTVITLIRHRCSSLRTRTDRAALAEERRTARLYRRAARNHAWHNWWRGNWREDARRIDDYEEKRSLIQHQESVLEDAMQEEIRQLRVAHGIVNELVGAEEGMLGRLHCPRPHHSIPPAPYSPISTTSTYPPTSLPELPSRPLSRTDSLPGYASSSPPAYEEDEDLSGIVPNGFRNYAPSVTASSVVSGVSSRWTPDSSIVDVSPRPSAETLRSMFERTEGAGDEDEKN